MAKAPRTPDLFDLTVTALSPILIMGLVGSLAYFLLDVLYAGRYTGKLEWTLFFFVVGAVLVARIAIVVDPGRANIYALALGGAVFLSMLRFMDYGPDSSLGPIGWLINLTIIIVVLWSAKKLVWNCTFIDESVEDPGRGLLAEIEAPAVLASQTPNANKREGSPGIWVIYFTLAAFPLFGLGQSLIPLADQARRRWAFWLMTVYVACGLGLLMTTTLLGLRRYLRQRKLTMPATMSGLWLGIGGALIVAFLVIGAFFPRPHAEYPLVRLTPVGAEDRAASRLGQGDEAGKGEGNPGAKGKDESAKDGSGQGQEGGKSEGKSGKPEGGKGEGEKGGDSKSKLEGKDGGGGGDQRGESGEKSDSIRPNAAGMFDTIANAIKWAVLVILGIPLLLFVTWYLCSRLNNPPEWLRKLLERIAAWWQSLFGKPVELEVDSDPVEVIRRPRPFADFANPFADGTAARRSPDELVRYSFAALDAWATERDLARNADETPREFALRIGDLLPDIEAPVRVLATHYANLAYGQRRVPEGARPQVEEFWLGLEGAPSQHEQSPTAEVSAKR